MHTRRLKQAGRPCADCLFTFIFFFIEKLLSSYLGYRWHFVSAKIQLIMARRRNDDMPYTKPTMAYFS